ncbi:MAG: helix-turn-helix domain-containing protein [Gaiellaceae bacterium]
MNLVVKTIGGNLRRIRTAQRLSLADLAARSHVAKATLANLEKGRGNPTIETLWALALGLGVAFSDLLEQPDAVEVSVVRSDDGVHVASQSADPPLDLRLLDRLERSGLTEVFEFALSGRHEGLPHGPGIVERVLVTSGRMLVGPADAPAELALGDFVRFPGDRPHVYASLDRPCRGVLLVEYPPAPTGARSRSASADPR